VLFGRGDDQTTDSRRDLFDRIVRTAGRSPLPPATRPDPTRFLRFEN